jgi:hypothetical protein
VHKKNIAATLMAAMGMLSFCAAARAQGGGAVSATELAAITARGRLVAEYDQAAWHSTDALMALKPSRDLVQLYVARKIGDRWTVMWGRFDETKTRFLIVYEEQEGADPTQYKVITHDPPVQDSNLYWREARAHELAVGDFLSAPHAHFSYNLSVLPAESGDWYVYLIPGESVDGVLAYGGDERYTISADGGTILDKQTMHDSLTEELTDHPVVAVHTLEHGDAPTDSDVFYSMTLDAAAGNLVFTHDHAYRIGGDGSITDLGKSDKAIKQLRDARLGEIAEPYRSLALAEAGRFLVGERTVDAMEAFASLEGARCDGGTLLAKFTILLHNTSGMNVALHPRALWNAQIRLAPSEKSLDDGHYEKIVNFIPDKADLSDEKSYIRLGVGMTYRADREYPLLGIDLGGKFAQQFLFFSWPPMEKDEIDAQRERFGKEWILDTDDILTLPAPLNLPGDLASGCPAK